MQQPFNQLVSDHRNLRTLLKFLSEEISHYDNALQQADITNVIEALDYISDYPQVFHHPLEEAAMEILENKNLITPTVTQRIHLQHQQIEQETRKLAALFDMIYNDHIVPLSRIKEQLASYYELQLEHLETEDKYMMPMFEKHLTAEDWQQAAAKIEEREDPLFHPHYIESYSELSHSLGLR